MRAEDGGVIVEFALVLPLLLLLLFGIIDFGRALYTLNNLTSAAREGARFAAVQASLYDTEPIVSVVEDRIESFGGGGGSPVINVTLLPEESGTIQNVAVEIRNYEFEPITPLAGMIGLETIPLGSRAVFRWERAG